MTHPDVYAGTHTGSNPSPDGFCDDPGCGCNAEPPARRVGPVVEAGNAYLLAHLDRHVAPPYSYDPERDGDPIVCPGCETPEATPAMHNIAPGVCTIAIEIDRVIGSAGSYCNGCGCHLGDEPHEEECDRGIDLATLRRIIGESVEDAPPIVITIRGGMVESIDNVPPGAIVEVRDFDVEQVDPSALVTDYEGRAHIVTIYRDSIPVPVASAADAFEAARELYAAYDDAEESGGVDWQAINDAQAAARRFVEANA